MLWACAGVAQLVEQLICNQQVGGSSPSTSSITCGRFPEWPKGADCKSVVTDFGGPNPPSPTNKKGTFVYQKFLFCLSKPQAWHIIECITRLRRDIHSYIITPFGAVSHHAMACIFPALDDIQHFVLLICNFLRNWWYTRLTPWFNCRSVV